MTDEVTEPEAEEGFAPTGQADIKISVEAVGEEGTTIGASDELILKLQAPRDIAMASAEMLVEFLRYTVGFAMVEASADGVPDEALAQAWGGGPEPTVIDVLDVLGDTEDEGSSPEDVDPVA